MYEDYVQQRISQLRLSRGVSAHDMSLSLGQNESYINRIENKKALPSLTGLFYICDYFHITPQEFFDTGMHNPEKIQQLIECAKTLTDKQLDGVINLIKSIE